MPLRGLVVLVQLVLPACPSRAAQVRAGSGFQCTCLIKKIGFTLCLDLMNLID